MKKDLTSSLESIITENTLIVCLSNSNPESEYIEQKLTRYLHDLIPAVMLTEKYFDLDGILLGLLNDASIKSILFILPIDFGEELGSIELFDSSEFSNFVSPRSITLQVLLELLKSQKKSYILGIQASIANVDNSGEKDRKKLDRAIKDLADIIYNIVSKKIKKVQYSNRNYH